MESLFEKFNIFDLFTMLIPGVVISTLLCVSLSFKYYSKWDNIGNDKYVIFFVLSYLYGIIFQQVGNILDKKIIYKIIYGGNPREIFLLKNNYNKLLDNKFAYENALEIKKYIIKHFNINVKNIEDTNQEKKLNGYIFSYCLNIIETNNLSYKADKMLVISEMSRSLSLGSMFIIILNIFMLFHYNLYHKFYLAESILLLILSMIFFYRKIQYEKYRYRIILREFLIYIKDKK